jgi:hypothetical protein
MIKWYMMNKMFQRVVFRRDQKMPWPNLFLLSFIIILKIVIITKIFLLFDYQPTNLDIYHIFVINHMKFEYMEYILIELFYAEHLLYFDLKNFYR